MLDRLSEIVTFSIFFIGVWNSIRWKNIQVLLISYINDISTSIIFHRI